MAWFIKQETFTAAMTSLSAEDRLIHRNAHRCWVEAQRNSGVAMASGFLVDDQHNPGGGGLLVFEASCYESAEALIRDDPMISRNLVTWTLHEWNPVVGSLRA
ncbi:MAG: hypothetical protein CMK50_00875 [Propionibacteriaceae bacterium]|jgi:uncharacterized protein YciI|nr:hypothetical protein [Propionibacteriaceae bacterium]MBT66236.1 hypothetical protein [Synechococcus sp. NP17]|tara:strand:+ start:9906 stop:10214 length:309 start_codon:yes stop_codon:yes gene_type:complete